MTSQSPVQYIFRFRLQHPFVSFIIFIMDHILGQSLALKLFCLMDHIHDQLTQLLRNENTLFKFFLIFLIVVHIYRCRSIRKQPSRGQLCSLYIFEISSFLYLLTSLCFIELLNLPNRDLEAAHPT